MLIQISVCLLIFILSYTTASKLFNFSHYSRSMLSQPFAHWVSSILIFLVPLIEIFLIILLIRSDWRRKGFLYSFFLMSAFTLYVFYVYFSDLDKSICPCGGLFSQLNWLQHLFVNSLLTLFSLAAYLLYPDTDNLFHGREKRGNADASESNK